MNSLLNAALLSLAFLALFGTSEFIYRVFKTEAEATRKFVHIGTGLLTLLFPILLNSHWYVLALCASFLLILIVSLKFRFLPSINKIDRVSRGSLYYPIIVYLVFVVYEWKSELIGVPDFLYFYLPVLTMALCDPLAAFVGSRWPLKKIVLNQDSKSIGGCLAFFVGAFLLSIFLHQELRQTPLGEPVVLSSLLIAFFAMISEAISRKGADNFFIPLTVSVLLIIGDLFIVFT